MLLFYFCVDQKNHKTLQKKNIFSETTNLFKPKQWMNNQVNNQGTGEPLVYICFNLLNMCLELRSQIENQ